MSLLVRQLPQFNAVPSATTQVTTVTCTLNKGEKVHAIHLEVGDSAGTTIGTLAAPTLLGDVRLKAKSKVQRECSIVQLNALNSRHGSQYAVKTSGTAGNVAYRTRIPIFLAEPWRDGVVLDPKTGLLVKEGLLSAMPTNGVESVQLEVDILSGITSPVIGGWYEYEESNDNLVEMVKWSRHTKEATGTPVEITNLSKSRGFYQSLHFFPTSDNKYITSMKFTRNYKEIRQDITRFQNDAMLLERGMNPTALDTTSNTTIQNTGLYNLEFDYDDPLRNALVVSEGSVSELTAKLTMSSAPSGNMSYVAIVAGPLD